MSHQSRLKTSKEAEKKWGGLQFLYFSLSLWYFLSAASGRVKKKIMVTVVETFAEKTSWSGKL